MQLEITGGEPTSKNDQTQAEIAVVGSLNADIFIRARRMPAPGETIDAGGILKAYGGKVCARHPLLLHEWQALSSPT